MVMTPLWEPQAEGPRPLREAVHEHQALGRAEGFGASGVSATHKGRWLSLRSCASCCGGWELPHSVPLPCSMFTAGRDMDTTSVLIVVCRSTASSPPLAALKLRRPHPLPSNPDPRDLGEGVPCPMSGCSGECMQGQGATEVWQATRASGCLHCKMEQWVPPHSCPCGSLQCGGGAGASWGSASATLLSASSLSRAGGPLGWSGWHTISRPAVPCEADGCGEDDRAQIG